MSTHDDMESVGLKTCGHLVATQINGSIYRDPCTVPVLEGIERCTKHGGLELVKQERAAVERTVIAQRKMLEEEVLPKATKRILDILNNEEAKDADIVNIWKTIMDRVGLAAVQGVMVEGSIHVEAPLDVLRKMLAGDPVIDGEIIE